MKALLIALGIIVVFVQDVGFAQDTAQPVSLVIHVDGGKRKAPAISNSELLIYDNNAKVATEANVQPAIRTAAVFAHRRGRERVESRQG